MKNTLKNSSDVCRVITARKHSTKHNDPEILTQEEVAQILGMTRSAVNAAERCAMEKFRKIMRRRNIKISDLI